MPARQKKPTGTWGVNITIVFRLSLDASPAVQGQMYQSVNLSYCMNLWTLGSKLHKNSCWTFFQ